MQTFFCERVCIRERERGRAKERVIAREKDIYIHILSHSQNTDRERHIYTYNFLRESLYKGERARENEGERNSKRERCRE